MWQLALAKVLDEDEVIARDSLSENVRQVSNEINALVTRCIRIESFIYTMNGAFQHYR
jgi:hypothetical protein